MDLLKFNAINLDAFTETYTISYYLNNLSTWPDQFCCVEDTNQNLMGYMMGKTEGRGEDWHGHVTSLTVAPSYRRLGLARMMTELLEKVSDQAGCYFVDLYVRMSNETAVTMYEHMGYTVFRRVREYYSGGVQPPEDAFDMRKPCSSDKERKNYRTDGPNPGSALISPNQLLIVGSGLGGLLLAHALHKNKFPYKIFERDSAQTQRAQGYGISVDSGGANGLKAALSPELFERFEKTSAEQHKPGGRVHGPSGRLEQAGVLGLLGTGGWGLVWALGSRHNINETAVVRMTTSNPDAPAVWQTERRVTVLGDAVHSMPPTGGQGANAALHDAALLAMVLSDSAEDGLGGWTTETIKRYEEGMRYNIGDVVVMACIAASKWPYPHMNGPARTGKVMDPLPPLADESYTNIRRPPLPERSKWAEMPARSHPGCGYD
ncbi:MAG: N-terminal acetyltransferase [Cyphobasidiales sp. Tagirdzhanova-0007]|nr:MAG: N-terminal acetyltransferase [Cyphobasidiales sp. Tagirdzhanova-0007]